jgi:8-oxo-dGTP pyrophosphatase MutT (NUDIX family)
MTLARFVALHEVPESEQPRVGIPRFAVVLARGPAGIVLVFNLYRRVWELPGGLIDPGESARSCAARELHEEAGCNAGPLEWLGMVEVNDGASHLGAVFSCAVHAVPLVYTSDETGGLESWTRRHAPTPMGHSDAALLDRLG